jgi:tetratricopeptide (TPR) repeat protein
MAVGGDTGTPRTFKASTAKQVLSRISRELGSDAVILSHRKLRDSKNRLWVEATASPRSEEAAPPRSWPALTKIQRKIGSRAFILLALGLVLAGAGVLTWRLFFDNKTSALRDRRLSVAVISFENQTGVASLGHFGLVIPNLLITSLEQSGNFEVTSWERLRDLLEQMGKGRPEAIDTDLGFELCRKDNVDALVTGSYTKAGGLFATNVKVIDVATKKIRKSATSQGNGEESILQTQIDELSREISLGLGFPAGAKDGSAPGVADITTHSTDAYYHYLKGRAAWSNENLKDARVFLERAVQLDPNFAMAHLYLASSLNLSGERPAALKIAEKARSLSARATEKERLFINAMAITISARDPDAALQLFTKMAQLYPKEKDSHFGLGVGYSSKGLRRQAIEEFHKALELDPYDSKTLGVIAIVYMDLGESDKAIEYLRRQIASSPGNGVARARLASIYLNLGRINEAMAEGKEAFAADPDLRATPIVVYVYALKENYDEVIRLMGRLVQAEKFRYFEKSIYDYWAGSLREAESDLVRLTEYAMAAPSRQQEANAHWMRGWIAYDKDEFDLCRASFKGWFDIYVKEFLPKRENFDAIRKHWQAWYAFYLGLADIKQGDLSAAKSRLREIHTLLPAILPEYRNWIAFYGRYLEAEISLAEGDVRKAIRDAEKLPALGKWGNNDNRWLYNVPFLRDVLAKAYRQNGDIGKAIAEYERLIRLRRQGGEQNLIHPKYYFRLAELCEKKGDRTNAAKHYEKFLSLWTNADPDIPEVIKAKQRLLSLKSGGES